MSDVQDLLGGGEIASLLMVAPDVPSSYMSFKDNEVRKGISVLPYSGTTANLLETGVSVWRSLVSVKVFMPGVEFPRDSETGLGTTQHTAGNLLVRKECNEKTNIS